MFKRLITKTDKKTLVFALVAFVAFALLVFIFPYSGDDWAWGSKIGLERLSTGFKDYNGRYAGNLLVMALTRSDLLNAVFTALSLVGVCILPKTYSGSKRFSSLLLAAALFLLMPKSIWVQAVSWTAGFSNYIPPILLTTVYMVITSNVFGQDKPVYGKLMPVAAFLIGFSASLFMENVTLYGVVLSLGIAVFAFIRHKKLFAVHVANFIGSVAGTALMFSNSAYGIIANANDGYRSTAASAGLFATLESHIATINYVFIVKNLLMFAVISLLCCALTATFTKSSEEESKKALAKKAFLINTICFAVLLLRTILGTPLSLIPVRIIRFVLDCIVLLVAVIYFLSVFATALTCIKDNSKKGAITAVIFSLPVLMAPLLVVSPIGPRCFFPPYFICIILCVCLYDCWLDGYTGANVEGFITKGLIAAASLMLAYLYVIYIPIHFYDVKRNEYALRQAELGYEKITICKLPSASYVWTGDPENEPWAERYKLFHGIDPEVEFEVIGHKEFNEWTKNFDREASEK